jgi:DNA repair exonuclease SbcCD ATPase subunit
LRQAEADAQHSKDLNDLRTRSKAAIDEVRAGHHTELNNINAAHEEALSTEVRSLEKKINNLTVDSNAARDDLAKAKSTLSTQAAELETLRQQLASTKHALEEALATPPTVAPSAELDAAKNELRSLKDDYETLKEVHQSSQEGFAAMMNNHKVELEEAAKGRVQALAALESKHQGEKSQHAEGAYPILFWLALESHCLDLLALAALQRRMEDERDAKDRALTALNSQQTRTPPITPRFGHIGGGVSKDELDRLYHAHNAKLAQLENEHRQAIAQLTYVDTLLFTGP